MRKQLTPENQTPPNLDPVVLVTGDVKRQFRRDDMVGTMVHVVLFDFNEVSQHKEVLVCRWKYLSPVTLPRKDQWPLLSVLVVNRSFSVYFVDGDSSVFGFFVVSSKNVVLLGVHSKGMLDLVSFDFGR